MRYNRAMNQVLTISCKLKVNESQAKKLEATLDAFVQALNWVNQNTPEKIVNAVKLQSLCYYEVRARFGLSSNLAQQVCRRVASSRKVAKQKNRPVKKFKSGEDALWDMDLDKSKRDLEDFIYKTQNAIKNNTYVESKI